MTNVQQEVEIWKGVIDYEDKYEISSFGRVRQTKTGKVLIGGSDDLGYKSIGLHRNQKVKRKQIHRLVMQSFVGECPEGMEVLHGDDNPSNNRLKNLRYGTRRDNVMDCISRGRFNNGMKGKFGSLNKGSKPVNMFDLNLNLIKSFGGVSEAGRVMGFTQVGVTHAIKKQRPIGKYFFAFANVEKPEIKKLNKKKNQRSVIQMDLNGVELNRYETPVEAMKVTGISTDVIRSVCRGTKRHQKGGGFKWKYAS